MYNSFAQVDELDNEILRIVLSSQREALKRKYSVQKSSPCNTHPFGGETLVSVRFSEQKYKYLLSYLVILHYWPLDEAVWFYLRMDLQEHIERNPNSFWLSALLESRDYFLEYLVKQQTMSRQKFFSSVCNKSNLILAFEGIALSFEEKLRRPKRIIRRRGYKDKGSLLNDSIRVIRKEEKKDWSRDLLQEIINLDKQAKQIDILHLQEYLRGERILSDSQLIRFKIIKEVKGAVYDEDEIRTEIKQKQRIIGKVN